MNTKLSSSPVRNALAACLLAALLAACTQTPTGRTQLTLLPESQMQQMGAAAFQQIREQQPVADDPRARRYVECVAGKITAVVPPQYRASWNVVVFADPSPNAFALPSGDIGVNLGMLDVAKSQDQLAAVLGHEVAHVIARHGNARVSTELAANGALSVAGLLAGQGAASQQLMGLLGVGAKYGVILPFSRAQETESDRLGLDLMARAGFDPRESIDLWQNMAAAGGERAAEFLSTHPAPQSRIQVLRERMDRALELRSEARSQGRRPGCER